MSKEDHVSHPPHHRRERSNDFEDGEEPSPKKPPSTTAAHTNLEFEERKNEDDDKNNVFKADRYTTDNTFDYFAAEDDRKDLNNTTTPTSPKPFATNDSYSPPENRYSTPSRLVSQKLNIRTSSTGTSNSDQYRDSPKSANNIRRHIARHERRDSLLGRAFNGGIPERSPPTSPQDEKVIHVASSLGSHVTNSQRVLEPDTDSDEDSPFPPPLAYAEQVSHRTSGPAVRIRPAGTVPINTHNARKNILAALREKRHLQDRTAGTLALTPRSGSGDEGTTSGTQLRHSISDSNLSDLGNNFQPGALLRYASSTSESPLCDSPKPPLLKGDVATDNNNTKSTSQNFYRLERGGVIVSTSMGPIQFGIPPETIKDPLSLGFEVPQVYVVPRDRFDTVAGLNMCEVEFPGYYQFFIRQSSLTLVVSAEAEKAISFLMKETLEGPPKAHLYTNDECVANPESRPDHVQEMAYFVRPRNGRKIDVSSMFKFVRFEPHSASVDPDASFGTSVTDGPDTVLAIAKLNDAIEIHETSREWIVFDKGKEISRVEIWLASMVPQRFPLNVLPTKNFVPPALGVTVLGSSHGFDPKLATSGFVLWMHGRGIMVDPPPNSTELLKRGGISPRLISAIILTHCHADHDAGTFQKILVEGRVTLITTKTILASFLRKYSKISGFTEAFLCRLFEPRIVRIGEDIFYGGGILRFFYAFHALPCIGFQCFVAGKSVVYSADTLYEPKMLAELCEEGVLSEGRRDSLLNFPFETADLVIHEAGIPPIHTPVDVLKNLSENALKRLYLIHLTEAAAEASGLRLARAGTDHTLRVISEGDHYAFNLDMMTHCELFLQVPTKYGRGIVSAAQDRMMLVDHDNPAPADFSFLDECSTKNNLQQFVTGPRPQQQQQRQHRESSLVTNDRDSDLSFSSLKRNSAGFENVSPTKNFITGRRTSQSTTKSLQFSGDFDEDDFTVPQVADIFRLSTVQKSGPGEIVSANEGEGDKDDAEDDILGEQAVEGPPGTILEPGDCFGLYIHTNNTNLVRRSVVRSMTDVEIRMLDSGSIWYMLNVYPVLHHKLSRMQELRTLESWKTMELNSCFRRLAAFQRNQLNSVLELRQVKAGEELWSRKPGPRSAFLVVEGELVFHEIAEEMSDRPFTAGAFLCDFHSMIITRKPGLASSSSAGPDRASSGSITLPQSASQELIEHPSSLSDDLQQPNLTLVAKTDARLYQMHWREAFLFLESNPGVLVQIYHSYVME